MSTTSDIFGKEKLILYNFNLLKFQEGYGLRIKQIHIITESKMVDALITFLKQVMSSKLGGRIHSHKTLDTFYEFIPKDILPEEYGGKERSLQTLSGGYCY